MSAEPVCHSLETILASGYQEMPLDPTPDMPGLGFCLKHKVHQAFRCTDGLWHFFRYADAKQAAERDLAMTGPMLPIRG